MRKVFFEITSVSRADVRKCVKFKGRITDAQMEKIARKMADDYLNQLYWNSLEIIADYVLNEETSARLKEPEDFEEVET